MTPENFVHLIIAGLFFGNLWLMLMYGKLKSINRNMETLCKMTEYQNSVLTHQANSGQPPQPPQPPQSPQSGTC